MDIKKRKEQLEKQFDEITAKVQQLLNLREQLRGQHQLLLELEKEPKDTRASKRRAKKIEEKIEK